MADHDKEWKIEGIDGEPWVRLGDGKTLANWSAEDRIRANQQSRQTQKYQFYVAAFDFLTDNRVIGDYHEYGSHRVRTFRMALTEGRRHGLDKMKFHSFDSFEGLPDVQSDTSVEIWKKGALTTTIETFWQIVKAHGIYVDNIRATKGYYDKSLTKELRDRYVKEEQKIAMACIDCDLYESAVPVFNFIEPLLQEGSLLYIDDYYAGYKGSPRKGVPRAFSEFQERCRFKFEPHMSIGWWGRSFIAYLP